MPLTETAPHSPTERPTSEVGGLREAVDRYQAQLIQQALQLSDGNWSAAARRLQLDRANLMRLAKRLAIS